MSRGPDAGTMLRRALEADARRAGCEAEVENADWTRWASATFTGARHEIVVAVATTPAADAWITALPDAELSRPTMLVADLKIVAVIRAADRTTLRIEVLTLEE